MSYTPLSKKLIISLHFLAFIAEPKIVNSIKVEMFKNFKAFQTLKLPYGMENSRRGHQ